MNIYEFMADSPGLTFFLAIFLTWFLSEAIRLSFIYLIGRPLRSMNIRKHGWPPPHCDADGDHVDHVDQDDDE